MSMTLEPNPRVHARLRGNLERSHDTLDRTVATHFLLGAAMMDARLDVENLSGVTGQEHVELALGVLAKLVSARRDAAQLHRSLRDLGVELNLITADGGTAVKPNPSLAAVAQAA